MGNNLGITMDQAQHRLKELWGIAETEASDRLAFFSDLESLVQPTPEVLSRYDQEISRLSEMLPLVDCVSRRDFVLHRLRESLKHQQHGSMQAEKLQQSEFAQELKRLNQQLSQALTTFEKRYSRRFLWKGEYILEHIQADLGQQIQASKLHAAHSVLDQIAANLHVPISSTFPAWAASEADNAAISCAVATRARSHGSCSHPAGTGSWCSWCNRQQQLQHAISVTYECLSQ